ncbi:MAG: tetratricopeptide repeat protein [Chloroflexi bacterium]|nr:tetratricopeptide repeat protein [Chloroflexota bacterium]
MAKVSLRIYNRDIEGLIDQGHLDEAIAHCRHILKTFPKHLETYRLLGKAYLEAKRYDEAVDIFSRTLMAVPDDFVSHVGMSIIRDEQGKLDEAIWHMQRAFECQPSNSAIQGELRRLFGRRDGMEPPKIRMTRGALAHMYVQGELYPQAISEIKAVLGQEADRDDMKVLLGQAYFHAGQRADASDICQQLLKRYPYCLDANRIMVELLQSSDSVETTQVYRHRVGELDPYANFVQGSIFRSNEVSDAAINLERFEYAGAEVDQGTWRAAGIELSASDSRAVEPDWLTADYPSVVSTPMEQAPVAAEASGDHIPDFLRDAGWTKSTGPEQPVSFDESSADENLAPANMPDWLKAMAPDEPAAPVADTPAEAEEWFKGLAAAGAVAGAATAAAPQPVADENVPDWLKGMDEVQPVGDENIPDWLKGMDESQPVTPIAAAEEPMSATASNENIADWLKGLDESQPIVPTDNNDLPDWLMPEPEPTPTPAPTPQVVTPPPAAPAASLDTLGTSAQEQDDAIAWLESLASKHGAKPEELVTDPNARKETPPEWVTQARELGEARMDEDQFVAVQPAAPVPQEVPAEPVTPPVPVPAAPAASLDTLGTSAQEQDDAIAWLESLASKHGAKPEELVTDPNARKETPPEWVTQARELSEAQPETPAPVIEPAPVPVTDETGVWLRDLSEKETTDEDLFAAAPQAEVTGPALDVADWLNELDNAEVVMPPHETEAAPAAPLEPLAAEAESLPDWLQGLDKEEETAPATRIGTDELPSWLKGEPEPPAQPEPITPSDWHPAEPESDLVFSPPLVPEQAPEIIYSPPLETPPPAPAPVVEPTPEPVNFAVESKSEPELEIKPIDFKPEPPKPVASKPAPAPKRKPTRVEKPASTPEPTRQAPVRRFTGMLTPAVDPALAAAQAEMNRGDIPAALEHYGRLIKRGKWLEEIIRDLRDALYRYPVEVTIWQTLGDAFMRENRLQEALDAYTKAEELLR